MLPGLVARRVAALEGDEAAGASPSPCPTRPPHLRPPPVIDLDPELDDDAIHNRDISNIEDWQQLIIWAEDELAPCAQPIVLSESESGWITDDDVVFPVSLSYFNGAGLLPGYDVGPDNDAGLDNDVGLDNDDGLLLNYDAGLLSLGTAAPAETKLAPAADATEPRPPALPGASLAEPERAPSAAAPELRLPAPPVATLAEPELAPSAAALELRLPASGSPSDCDESTAALRFMPLSTRRDIPSSFIEYCRTAAAIVRRLEDGSARPETWRSHIRATRIMPSVARALSRFWRPHAAVSRAGGSRSVARAIERHMGLIVLLLELVTGDQFPWPWPAATTRGVCESLDADSWSIDLPDMVGMRYIAALAFT